jgi:DNA-binding PadR family transcriptional regulator
MSAPALELTPAGWAVLGVVAEAPIHGFAVAALLAPAGPLGQVWSLPRPLVYRELTKLDQLGLVVATATERSEQGPARTIMTVTPDGQRAVRDWLTQPVEHVRDVRSLLLLKLALLDRSGVAVHGLLAAQRATLVPQLAGLHERLEVATGFERLLAQWRLASSTAVLQFIDAALSDPPR